MLQDIWGAELHQTSNNEDGPVKIGTLYFDVQRLKDWCSAQNDQMKLDKYEKIRIVGQGQCDMYSQSSTFLFGH